MINGIKNGSYKQPTIWANYEDEHPSYFLGVLTHTHNVFF